MKSIAGIIPARYGSTRFPGKPLHLIAGKPLIQHVVERCRQSDALSEVIVATDDERIAGVTRNFCTTVMTRDDHPSGTDRIAEAAAGIDVDAVINIQGDEPLIDPGVIDAVAGKLGEFPMSTAAVPIHDPAALDNPDIVKVVTGAEGQALYFSRALIPWPRDCAGLPRAELLKKHVYLHHMGIYGYTLETLMRLVALPVSPLEHMEKLEQLRALEAGIPIGVVMAGKASRGVDRPEDVAAVEAILAGNRSSDS